MPEVPTEGLLGIVGIVPCRCDGLDPQGVGHGGTLVRVSVESDALLREALSLSASERARVAAELLVSLEEPTVDDLDSLRTAWAEELEVRARRALSGQDVGHPWPTLLDRVRSRLSR